MRTPSSIRGRKWWDAFRTWQTAGAVYSLRPSLLRHLGDALPSALRGSSRGVLLGMHNSIDPRIVIIEESILLEEGSAGWSQLFKTLGMDGRNRLKPMGLYRLADTVDSRLTRAEMSIAELCFRNSDCLLFTMANNPEGEIVASAWIKSARGAFDYSGHVSEPLHQKG